MSAPTTTTSSSSSNASKPRRRFVGTRSKPSSQTQATQIRNQIPLDILDDTSLNTAISQLPSNYSFEIHKTIWHVRKNNATMVALQMPEGLQMFACVIADIIERFTPALTTILGDVTYGACCIDDYTAVALGCDMLIHYGHSCLVPMDQINNSIKTLYVFVEISIDSAHLAKTIRRNLPSEKSAFKDSILAMDEMDVKGIEAGTKIYGGMPQLRIEADKTSESEDLVKGNGKEKDSQEEEEPTRLALVSTIQFVAALQQLKENLSIPFPVDQESESSQPSSETNLWKGKYQATIPRSKPLSPGEILGCTAPRLEGDVDALIYLGDGRFHLESIMIANPNIPAFRYDPYSKKLTRERYDHAEMRSVRGNAISTARKSIARIPDQAEEQEPLWGVVLGTLGRQGSFRQLQAITHQLTAYHKPIPFMPILLSELSPAKLALFKDITTFVQTSCPRLSIDWGYAFDKPLLSPYETAVVVGETQAPWMEEAKDKIEEVYPMDFYAAGTPWAISRVKGNFSTI